MMNETNLGTLKSAEENYNGHLDNFEDTVNDVMYIVDNHKSMSKDVLERELIQLIINVR